MTELAFAHAQNNVQVKPQAPAARPASPAPLPTRQSRQQPPLDQKKRQKLMKEYLQKRIPKVRSQQLELGCAMGAPFYLCWSPLLPAPCNEQLLA